MQIRDELRSIYSSQKFWLARLGWSVFLLLSSCTWTNEHRSYLILAADHLQPGDLNCHRESTTPLKSGFAELCKSSVRFSHAFTTSTLTLPAMSSLMTGAYPFQFQVRDNGANFLSSRWMTLAKAAKEKGLQTGFFTGGAPLLRNSGLQIGFDNFDDNINISNRRLFRSAEESLKAAQAWIKSTNEAFFAAIYFPDLAFINQPTTSELGEPRNLSIDSQVEELDFRLYQFFNELKKNKRWDSTNIVLVGLNGRNSIERKQSLAPLNVHAEQTQIALLFKPASKPRDEGIYWSFDGNVSLADVGATILAMLDAKPQSSDPDFPAISLQPVMKDPDGLSLPSRWLPVESFWGPWRGLGRSVVGLREDGVFVIKQATLGQFSTLADNLELSPVPITPGADLTKIEKLIAKIQGPDDQNPQWAPPELFEYNFWTHAERQNTSLRLWQKTLTENPLENQFKAVSVVVKLAVRHADWSLLMKLGQVYHVRDWQALAERNMGTRKIKFANPCLRVIDERLWSDVNQRRNCQDRKVSALLEVLASENDSVAFHRALRFWVDDLVFSRIQETNWALALPWNLSEVRSAESHLWQLSLAHPNMQKIRTQLQREPL